MKIATANSILITGESLHPNPFELFCRCFAHLSRNSFLPKLQWIWSTGFQLLGDDHPRADAGHLRRFRSIYGAPPEDVAVAWNLIEEDPPEGIRKNRSTKHLLWALALLKNYATEVFNAKLFKCDDDTWRYWSTVYISALAKLSFKIVSAFGV